jgi:predicted ATP-dependent serine protease
VQLQGERIARPWDKHKTVERGAIDLQSADLFAALPIQLDAEQIDAARQALQNKVFVITGGPGTGKTTLLMSLLAILRRAKVTFVLAAPTGRAAKRMSETSGEEAMTIHRLLEYNPREGGFQRHEDNPVQAAVIIAAWETELGESLTGLPPPPPAGMSKDVILFWFQRARLAKPGSSPE